MFVEGIVMVLFCSAFWPYQKVSIVVLNYMLCFAYFCHLADNESGNGVKYCRFWHQLLHTSLQKILKPIKPLMYLGCNKDQWRWRSKCISYVVLRGATQEQ